MDETTEKGAIESTNELEAANDSGDVDNTGGTTTPGPTGDPDIDSSLELIVATFPDEGSADAAFTEIKEAEKEELILLVDAAVVNRDEGSNLHIKEERDWPGRAGALLGAGIGAILGMVGGPIGLVVGGAAGAAIGAAAAAGKDAGIPDERLKEFAKALKPGASMVIVVVAHFWSAAAAAILTHAGGEVNTTVLTDEIAQKLNLNKPG